MAAADKYQIMVSGLGGRVYIGTPSKKPGVMSSNRRIVDDSEFITAILQWAEHKLEKEDDDTVYITKEDGTVDAEIVLRYKQKK